MYIVDTENSFERYIKSKEEVNIFLNQVKVCLEKESLWKINDKIWMGGRVNKTQTFLAEKNLQDNDVAEFVRELQVSDYCYTVNDRNEKFVNETFWIFGITRIVVDSEEKLYIKLKIRKFDNEILLIMSFHPEQPLDVDDELTFPYGK